VEIFQWNALRRGHRVTVHDPASPAMSLLAGTVAIVDVVPGRGRSNRVGVRVAGPDGTTRVIRPSPFTAHLDPDDSSEPCWRCEEIGRTATPTRQCGRCRETFPGDGTLPVGAIREWWACPPCRAQLFGSDALAAPDRPAEPAPARP
jgi:hypothetical protein